MGFLSSIGKAVGKVAGVVGDIGGIASGISSAAGLFGYSPSTDDARAFATSSAAQANAYTKEMMQKKYQWQVADMRAAGLNPILAATNGAPVGGSAQAVSGANAAQDQAALANSIANNVSSGAAAKQQKLNSEKLISEIELLKANAAAAKSQGVKNLADAKNTGNISNVTENLGNLATGFHGITSNAAKKVQDIDRNKTQIINKLKQAPSDYWWALKNLPTLMKGH